ncbi:MAG: HAD family phosphatase [Candidatus Eremiobacteraeota bacterium]|nr:HAD family phosphatase [Candidatus Eremiobacteraeota bacterium]
MWPRRRQVQALVFDVGGVLVKTQLDGFLEVGSLLFGCPEDVLKTHITALIEELERGEIDSYALWEELGETLAINGLGQPQEPEKLEALWHQSIDESLILIPEMLELCRGLQGKIPMAVLSNTIQDHADNLRARGVYELFNPCVLSCEVGMRKPEHRIYQAVCELLNTPPENCLFIDDLQANIKAAKACRMQTHHFADIERFRKRLAALGLQAT